MCVRYLLNPKSILKRGCYSSYLSDEAGNIREVYFLSKVTSQSQVRGRARILSMSLSPSATPDAALLTLGGSYVIHLPPTLELWDTGLSCLPNCPTDGIEECQRNIILAVSRASAGVPIPALS